MLSSSSFKVFGLTFKSLINFLFIFLCGIRKCSSFILLHVAIQFSQHHLLKRLFFLHCIFSPPLSKIRCPYIHGFTSGLSILFSWPIFQFCASTVLSWWLSWWSEEGWFLQLQFSFSSLLWLFKVICVSIQVVNFLTLILWTMSFIIW